MAENLPLLGRIKGPPLPTYTFARDGPFGKRPQAIAHRGYKAKYPENTMSAFRAAIETGAHAIETDLHLTQDGVAVLSHDPTLGRCFGKSESIADCTWDYISTLKTTKSPHEPMPRLEDLLEYLTTPGLEDIWVLLDVKLLLPSFTDAFTGNRAVLDKLDKHADNLFKAIAAALERVPSSQPWGNRILVACWAAKYLPLCLEHLPGYAITYNGFSVDYARQFLKVPSIGFNMFLWLIIGPRGSAFMRQLRTKYPDRFLLLWTVNEPSWMKWCIRQGADGVITDDPKTFLEVCKAYDKNETLHHSWASWKLIAQQLLRSFLWGLSFRCKHGFWLDMQKVAKAGTNPS